MKTVLISLLWVFGIGLFIWGLFAYGAQPSYTQTASAGSVQEVLEAKGLHICSTKSLSLDKTPGLETAKELTVSTNCSADVNPLKVALMQFSDEAARNAALQRASGAFRSGYGPYTVYTYGPYVLVVQGTQTLADQALLSEAIHNANQ